jgi:carbon-monoxide dehydrogenase large subunit
MDWIRISKPLDTNYSSYEWQTVASRITWTMGNAILDAAKDARKQIFKVVGKAWKENKKDLEIKDGIVYSKKTKRKISLKEFVITGIPKKKYQGWIGGPIIGRGKFMPTYVTGLDKDTGQGKRAVVHYTTGAQGFIVEVDTLTGKLDIIKAVSAFDVGKAINPDLVKAQIEGGMVQGISSALFEQLVFKEGVLQNPNFVDYRIATTMDLPGKMECYYVEVPQDDGPFGARGIGEHPMVPTIAAIANAIYDAVGIRLEGPPFTAEKLFMAMKEKGKSGD